MIFFISFNEMSIISKYNLKSTNERTHFLTFCTKNKVCTHQHEAHHILEDFLCVVLYFSTQYPNALASYFFYALSVSRFLNFSVSCYSQRCSFRFFESDSFNFKLLDKGYNFLLFVFIPEAPIFWMFFLIHRISCLGLEGSMNSGLTN